MFPTFTTTKLTMVFVRTVLISAPHDGVYAPGTKNDQWVFLHHPMENVKQTFPVISYIV